MSSYVDSYIIPNRVNLVSAEGEQFEVSGPLVCGLSSYFHDRIAEAVDGSDGPHNDESDQESESDTRMKIEDSDEEAGGHRATPNVGSVAMTPIPPRSSTVYNAKLHRDWPVELRTASIVSRLAKLIGGQEIDLPDTDTARNLALALPRYDLMLLKPTLMAQCMRISQISSKDIPDQCNFPSFLAFLAAANLEDRRAMLFCLEEADLHGLNHPASWSKKMALAIPHDVYCDLIRAANALQRPDWNGVLASLRMQWRGEEVAARLRLEE